MELLKIDKIDTGYGKKPVLFDISMSVNEGEIVSVIGPNVAGKSTVLKAVSGLLPLWQGGIFFESISIKKNTTAQCIFYLSRMSKKIEKESRNLYNKES